mmetsp:Transcript_73912/g.196730  ORF Transcript_73912/g.196730 Transcript_73912/m.196730 type:complete len:112 (-) Transcript_73912:1504-1839(-)
MRTPSCPRWAGREGRRWQAAGQKGIFPRNREGLRMNNFARRSRSSSKRLGTRRRLHLLCPTAHDEAMPAAAALSSGGTALELPGAMHERATLSKRRSISGAQRVKFLDQKL